VFYPYDFHLIMKRSYYQNTISNFLLEDQNSILGQLSLNHANRTLEELQRNAWVKQIAILKDQLKGFAGKIYFEFAIPRMGKRVDNIIIIEGSIFVVEFKVGDGGYEKHAEAQVIDYTLDLKNFHEGSHNAKLIPVLVATNAENTTNFYSDICSLEKAAKCNKDTLYNFIEESIGFDDGILNSENWETSIYKPTPTIIEAAQALYQGHNVKDISRSDSGAINLSKTTNCLNEIIDNAKNN